MATHGLSSGSGPQPQSASSTLTARQVQTTRIRAGGKTWDIEVVIKDTKGGMSYLDASKALTDEFIEMVEAVDSATGKKLFNPTDARVIEMHAEERAAGNWEFTDLSVEEKGATSSRIISVTDGKKTATKFTRLETAFSDVCAGRAAASPSSSTASGSGGTTASSTSSSSSTATSSTSKSPVSASTRTISALEGQFKTRTCTGSSAMSAADALADQIVQSYGSVRGPTVVELSTTLKTKVSESLLEKAGASGWSGSKVAANAKQFAQVHKALQHLRDTDNEALATALRAVGGFGIGGRNKLQWAQLQSLLTKNVLALTDEEKRQLVHVYTQYVKDDCTDPGDLFFELAQGVVFTDKRIRTELRSMDIVCIIDSDASSGNVSEDSTFKFPKANTPTANICFLRRTKDASGKASFQSFTRTGLTPSSSLSPSSLLDLSHAASKIPAATTVPMIGTLTLIPNAGGGDCALYSIADQLTQLGITHSMGKSYTADELRDLAARALTDKSRNTDMWIGLMTTALKQTIESGEDIGSLNIDKIQGSAIVAILQKSGSKPPLQLQEKTTLQNYYAGYIALSKRWLDAPALQALAECFNLQIAVVRGDKIEEKLPDGEITADRCLFIQYDGTRVSGGGVHYQSVKREKTEIDKLVRANKDKALTDFATSIAGEFSTWTRNSSRSGAQAAFELALERHLEDLQRNNRVAFAALCKAISQKESDFAKGSRKKFITDFAGQMIPPPPPPPPSSSSPPSTMTAARFPSNAKDIEARIRAQMPK